MQKSAAIVRKFRELASRNASFRIFPEQLLRVRLTPWFGPHGDAQEPICDVPSMTQYFVERVFEVHVKGACPVTGMPAMSLEEFADFLLAWNYRGQTPSARRAI